MLADKQPIGFMDASDFHPKFAPKQIAFIKARRSLTMRLCVLFSLLRREGFPDSTSGYQIFGPDGSTLRQENHHQLDGQQVRTQIKFSHQGRDYVFCAILTNDENWNLIILVTSNVVPERRFISGVGAADLKLAYEDVQQVFWSTATDFLNEQNSKTNPQSIGIDG